MSKNWSGISTPAGYAAGILKYDSDYNIWQNKSEFRVLVLDTPEHYSGPEGGMNPDVASKYRFQGRILDKTMTHVQLLDSPCDMPTTSDPQCAWLNQNLHITVSLSISGEEVTFDAGDVIIATTEPGSGDNIYGMQYMKFLRVEDKDNQMAVALSQDCSSWVDVDWADAAALGSGATYSPPLVVGGSSGEGEWVQNADGIQFWRYAKSFSVLDRSVAADFEGFFAELKTLGYAPMITSARRSVKHQWMIRTEQKGYSGMSTAKPCRSDHQYGFAIDMNAGHPDAPGGWISSKTDHSWWRKIEAVANRYNLIWYGPGDEVHFYHVNAKQVLSKLKQKCTDYYYPKYGDNVHAWPTNFLDELEYIDPPVPGIPMMDDAAAVAQAAEEEAPPADSELDTDAIGSSEQDHDHHEHS